MKEYVWLFPIIFMFHDMEEIIGFKYFLRQNTAELQQRFPFILRRYIPACITSLICLPVNTLIICKCLLCIVDSALYAGAFMAVGAILVFVNIFIAQKLMGWFTKKTA